MLPERNEPNLHGGCLATASGVVILQGSGEQVDVHGDTLIQVVLPGNGDGEVALLISLNFQVVLAVNLDGTLVQLDSDGGAGGTVLGQEAFAGNLQGFALVPDLRNMGGRLVGVDVGDGLFTVLSESCGDCGDYQTATDQGGGTEASDSVSNVHPIILSPRGGFSRLSRGYVQLLATQNSIFVHLTLGRCTCSNIRWRNSIHYRNSAA